MSDVPLDRVAPGVLGTVVEEGGVLWILFLYAEQEGSGDVGRYLDSLPTDRKVVLTNVLNEVVAGMLERRGFTQRMHPALSEAERLMRGGAEIPVWVREPRQRIE